MEVNGKIWSDCQVNKAGNGTSSGMYLGDKSIDKNALINCHRKYYNILHNHTPIRGEEITPVSGESNEVINRSHGW